MLQLQFRFQKKSTSSPKADCCVNVCVCQAEEESLKDAQKQGLGQKGLQSPREDKTLAEMIMVFDLKVSGQDRKLKQEN